MSIAPTSGSPHPPSQKPGALGKQHVDIVTIPEKFYGVALTMNGATQSEREVPAPLPPPRPAPAIAHPSEHRAPWALIIVIVVLVLGVGGVFAYVNRDLLFRKPVPVSPPPPPKLAPATPMNLSATSSGSAVSLVWVDGGGDESGVRIERQDPGAGYVPITVLPAGSAAFLDVSVQLSRAYTYRVVAFGEGGESSPSNEASARTSDPLPPLPPLPPPPPVPGLPPGGLDSDSDGLTDVEETLYGTDAHTPDADNDGFLDGNEVFHLYNPAAKSPVRLLDSGLVKSFAAPVGWSLLVPASWTTGLDVPDGSQATIATGRGETISLHIEDNPTAASLSDWYMARTPGESASSVHAFVTKTGLQGIAVSDQLEALFVWGGKVFRVKYQTDGQPFINYRTTFEMMLNSLKLVGVPAISAPSDAAGGPGSLTGAATSTSMVTTEMGLKPTPTDATSSTLTSIVPPPASLASSTSPLSTASSSTGS